MQRTGRVVNYKKRRSYQEFLYILPFILLVAVCYGLCEESAPRYIREDTVLLIRQHRQVLHLVADRQVHHGRHHDPEHIHAVHKDLRPRSHDDDIRGDNGLQDQLGALLDIRGRHPLPRRRNDNARFAGPPQVHGDAQKDGRDEHLRSGEPQSAGSFSVSS